MSSKPVQLRARGAREARGGVGVIWNAAQIKFFQLSIRNRLPHKLHCEAGRFRLRLQMSEKWLVLLPWMRGERFPAPSAAFPDAGRTHPHAGTGGYVRKARFPLAAPRNSAHFRRFSPRFSLQHGRSTHHLAPSPDPRADFFAVHSRRTRGPRAFAHPPNTYSRAGPAICMGTRRTVC